MPCVVEQVGYDLQSTAGTTITYSFTADLSMINPTEGNALVVVAMAAGVTVTSITDNQANTWTTDADEDSSLVKVFSAPNISSGVTEISITFASNTAPWVFVHEVSGMAASAPAQDYAAWASSGFATSHSYEYTTVEDGEFVIIAAHPTVSRAVTGTSGTTANPSATTTARFAAYKVPASAETGNVTFDFDTGSAVEAAVVSYSPAAATGYTLTADGGSFSLGGTANAMVHGRTMAADSGTFSLSGTDATLAGGNSLAADSGTFTLSGTDAGLAYVSGLTADSGTFTLSGTDATLAGGFYMFAEMGAVVMTADAVTFSTGIRLSAESGTFTHTGTDVDFSRAYNPLAADAASYALTGADAALYWQHAIPAESGAYALTGADASISSTGAYGLTAETGPYALTGASITFGLGLGLAAESGTYQISGADADLLTGLGAIGSLPTGPLRQGQYRSDQAGRTTTNT